MILAYIGFACFWFVVFGAITAAVAQKRGHEPLGWFLFGGLLFIVALPLVLLLDAPKAKASRNAPRKNCPYCGQAMPVRLRSCPACGRGQPVTATSDAAAWQATLAASDEVANWAKTQEDQAK